MVINHLLTGMILQEMIFLLSNLRDLQVTSREFSGRSIFDHNAFLQSWFSGSWVSPRQGHFSFRRWKVTPWKFNINPENLPSQMESAVHPLCAHVRIPRKKKHRRCLLLTRKLKIHGSSRYVNVNNTQEVQRPLKEWVVTKDHCLSKGLQSTIWGDYYFNGLWLPDM